MGILFTKESEKMSSKHKNEEFFDLVLPQDHSRDNEIWVTSFDVSSAIQFKKDIFRIFELDPKKPMIININSSGGPADGLFMMLDAMDSVLSIADQQKFCFVTACMGIAMSAGAVLLSHGRLRFASPLSSVMLHQVQSGVFGSLPDMDVEYDEIKKVNERVLTILNKNCKVKGGIEVLRELVSRNRYLTPQEAKEFGIIDAIGYPKIIEHREYEVGLTNGRIEDESKPTKPNKRTGKKASKSESSRNANKKSSRSKRETSASQGDRRSRNSETSDSRISSIPSK